VRAAGTSSGHGDRPCVRVRSGRLGPAGQEVLLGRHRAPEVQAERHHRHDNDAPRDQGGPVPSAVQGVRPQAHADGHIGQRHRHGQGDFVRGRHERRVHTRGRHHRRGLYPHMELQGEYLAVLLGCFGELKKRFSKKKIPPFVKC